MGLSSKVLKKISHIVGKEGLLCSPTDLLVYEYDASLEKGRPAAVVFPTSRDQVVNLVRLASKEGVPFVARGSGTNLSGGSIPPDGGLIIEFSRMNRILEIDQENLRATVEPGLFTIELSNALAPYGYYYAPDPASQKVSTFGGNVGENSGGPHCLKYGVTTNHVLGLEVVLPDGEVVELGGKTSEHLGYDLVGVLVGSEGTLGIITKIIVRIMKVPESVKTFLAIYDSIEDAGESVSAIIAQGILPATLELMDKTVIAAVEASLKSGYPLDAEAVLIIELDGLKESMDRLSEKIVQICREHGARDTKAAQSPQEREALWAGRRGAFGAIARVAPNYLVTDGTVPRNRIPEVLRRVSEIGKKYNLPIGNVLHAGDGNLHPLILFDERNQEEKERVLQAGLEILEACAAVGGTISGEHGIGLEKIVAMPLVCGMEDLRALRYVKETFDPCYLCNPRKILPEEGMECVAGARSDA
jgi:glycolate oxidase